MRIIAGEYRGRKLKSPEGREVRPTSDRVKESLFNILQSKCKNAVVLDLFAGSGNLGIEALSRGAKRAVFVDNSSVALAVLRNNVADLRLQNEAEVWAHKAETAVVMLGRMGYVFDVIFIDPPYAYEQRDLLQIIKDSGIVNQHSLVLVEHATKKPWKPDVGWVAQRKERWGDTAITFFCLEEERHAGDVPGDV